MKIDVSDYSLEECDYLNAILNSPIYPTLEDIWALMDAAWDECRCNPEVMDERISKFYGHPVWLLNGLFIEQHAESITHRQNFTEYVASLNPKRVADFGGGYGTLARMIGARCPDAEVHIVEPYPHLSAVKLAARTPNVCYISTLQGDYDVLIATDVFEHVPDPLFLLENTVAHLRTGGEYLIANCFWPVILCHLPSTFHFRWSWDYAMVKFGLQPANLIAYGRIYRKNGPIAAGKAKGIEQRSKRMFRIIELTPAKYRGSLQRLLFSGL